MSPASVRAWITENWGLKLLSLGFALLLWMFVVGEKRSEISLSPPLELTRVPETMVIVSRVPESVRVRLNGPRTLLAAMNSQQVVVSLDLEGIRPGISSFEILPSRLNLPRGVEVTYISPSVITLEADQKVRRVLPVKPRIKGTPVEGYEVAEVRAEPPEIDVEGAERVLKQLKEIPTEMVDVTGLEGSQTRPVELALPDPTLRPVEKRSVRVETVIREIQSEREFIQVPIKPPGPQWSLNPAAVDIRVAGPLRVLSKLRAKDLVVSVELSGEDVPRGPVPLVVQAPQGSRILSVKPEEVRISKTAQ